MCGIVGVIHAKSGEVFSEHMASMDVYRGLLALQHRGQDAAGILSFDFDSLHFEEEKNLGLVSQVFGPLNLKLLKGQMAIGHNRYATVGSNGKRDLQPMAQGLPYGLGLAHNGNLVNYYQLREDLQRESHIQLLTRNDLEAILQLWSQGLLKKGGPFHFEKGYEACVELFQKAQGSYAVVGLVAGEGLVAFRDPHGIKPLCLGKRLREDGGLTWAVASEEVALNFLGLEFVRDVMPGEFLFISANGTLSSRVWKKVPTAHCMFEWVYFASAESSLEKESVYGVRLRLGQKLAQKLMHFKRADIVVPVPDTGRTGAISLAEELRIPYREGLIKNRYVQRSFILNTQDKREKAVELKLSPIKKEIEGKSILLVDDSIVRGTTSKKIISLLYRYGAKEITMALTCPPIRFGCFYGIDFPESSKLLAQQMSEEKMAEWLGVSRVVFTTIDDLVDAIGISGLCVGCLNGKYPTDVSEGERFAHLRESFLQN